MSTLASSAVSNIVANHRALYFEATGDGAATVIVVTLPHYARPTHTGTCYGITTPTFGTVTPSGKGGLSHPSGGSAVTISSATVSSNTLTVTLGSALGNGTKGYFTFVFNEFTAL